MSGIGVTNDFDISAADGVTTVFTYTFFAYEASQVKVYSVLDDVETAIVAGITITPNSSFVGGTVTFAVAPAAGVGDILRRREVPYTQTTEFTDLVRYKETAIEKAFNTLVMQTQQVFSKISRSLRYTEAANVTDVTIETPEDGKALVFDGITGRLRPGPTATDIENAQPNAAAAAVSAAAAQAAQSAAEAAAAGMKWRPTVRAATAAALPACTYANGTGGVGATLTGNVNGALAAQDGITLIAGDRLLVKNQVAALQNGVYTVTQVGTGGTPFILTRATDADTWLELTGQVVSVEEGTVNLDDTFICTINQGGTIGTTDVTWANFRIPITSQPSASVATGDNIIFSDVSDSGKVKQDTVTNLLALSSALGRVINVQTFTSSGTYTRTAGVTKAIAIVLGSTGGGSANSTNNGTAGGTTSFGSLLSVTGGAGGTLKTVDDTFIPAASGAITGGVEIGRRAGGAGASGYDGGGQWRHAQPGGPGPVAIAYVTPGATETVTIGAAGTGGAAGLEAGQNGLAGVIVVIELS